MTFIVFTVCEEVLLPRIQSISILFLTFQIIPMHIYCNQQNSCEKPVASSIVNFHLKAQALCVN